MTVRQAQVAVVPAAVSAQPPRWKPAVRLHELCAVPGALVFQLGQESSHSGVGDGPGQPPVAQHHGHVQRFHHHAAGALGYRGRRLVVIVIPDLNDPGVYFTALDVQALPPVAVVAPAVDFPGPGDGLVHLAQPPDCGLQRLGILHLQTVGAHRQRANSNVNTDGGPALDWRGWLAVLNAEAGKPHAGGPVDGDLADRAGPAQLLHHRHSADPGQQNLPVIHPYCARPVIGT